MIEVRHPRTNSLLTCELHDRTTYIYGGNGTGKTTIGRSFSQDTVLLFNQDYVNKNVFITSPTGAKTDTTTKENFSNIFIGEIMVEAARNVENIKQLANETKTVLADYISNLNEILIQSGISSIAESEINSYYDREVEYNFSLNETVANNLNVEVQITPLETLISNENELDVEVSLLKNESIHSNLLEDINSSEYLQRIVESRSIQFTDIQIEFIENFNRNIMAIVEAEEIFRTVDNANTYKNWVKEGLPLHSESSSCLFCHSSNIQESLAEWSNMLEGELETIKNNMLLVIMESKTAIERVLQKQEMYLVIAPNFIISLLEAYQYVEEIHLNIITNQEIDIRVIDLELDNILAEAVSREQSIKNFIVNSSLNDLVVSHSLKAFYDNELNAYKTRIQEQINEASEVIETDINQFLQQLGYDIFIQTSTDNRSKTPRINLSRRGESTNLNSFSEGEKHKLALAIFLSDLKRNRALIDYVVLDDPVVSLDKQAYFNFQSVMRNEIIRNDDTKVVMLTHNVDLLYILINNLINSEEANEIFSIFELSADGLRLVEPEIFNYDDLTLFLSSVHSSDNIEDFSLTYWLTYKILRYFLDFTLRMQNQADRIGNPAAEILALDLEDESKDRLQEISNRLVEICRMSTVTLPHVNEAFRLLNESMVILGYRQLISDDVFHILDNLEDDVNILESEIRRDDIIANILVVGRDLDIGEDGGSRYLRNYLNHPRTQLTSSLITTISNRDF